MIDDVVAVSAAGPGLQVGRGVAVGDPQVAQIGHDRQGIAERESGVKLQPVSRFGQPPRRVGRLCGLGLAESSMIAVRSMASSLAAGR